MLLLLLLSCFNRVWLCATPEMAAHEASPSLGFSRQEHWSGLPFPSPMHESEKWKWSHSVMSDSSRPHGLQPTSLLHPWNFPGKSTGVGCHCLLRHLGHIPSIKLTMRSLIISRLNSQICCPPHHLFVASLQGKGNYNLKSPWWPWNETNKSWRVLQDNPQPREKLGNDKHSCGSQPLTSEARCKYNSSSNLSDSSVL